MHTDIQYIYMVRWPAYNGGGRLHWGLNSGLVVNKGCLIQAVLCMCVCVYMSACVFYVCVHIYTRIPCTINCMYLCELVVCTCVYTYLKCPCTHTHTCKHTYITFIHSYIQQRNRRSYRKIKKTRTESYS